MHGANNIKNPELVLLVISLV